jgi:glucan phosphoethanolaminetransferase (alkaline phosphatase superfamily)
MDLATGLLTGFGLAGAAGLNAYLPLLIVALAGRFTDWVHLTTPFDALTSWWAIALLVLLTVEIFVDKVPAVDTVNDVIQTAVRPAAGAVLFAASTNVITDIHPVLAIVCGLLVAGGVHAVKATARPVITTMGGGVLNPVVSTTEDVVSAGTSVAAILLPLATFVIFVLLVLGFYLWVRRRKQRRAEYSEPM